MSQGEPLPFARGLRWARGGCAEQGCAGPPPEPHFGSVKESFDYDRIQALGTRSSKNWVLGHLEIGAGFAGTAGTGELPGAGGVQNLGQPALAVF